MANQNAEQNAPATTDDAGEQGVESVETTEATDQATADNNVSNETEAPASDAPAAEATASDAPASDASTSESSESSEGASQAPSRFSAPQNQPSQGELLDGLKPMGEAPTEKKEVANGRSYEIVVIVRNSQEDDLEAITVRMRELIEAGEGAIDNLRTSEARRLAYPIEKETEGRYVVVNARFAKTVVLDLDRFFKLEEGVLRHMILREDD